MRKYLKKIPALKLLVLELRVTLQARRLRKLFPAIFPLRTDKKLIRLGAHGDGGYVIPDDLNGITTCFSPGVSLVSKFEMDCAQRGMKVFLADASVDYPAENHALFEFRKIFIGSSTREGFISLEDWINQSIGKNNDDLLLQMDIESFEYEVLHTTPSDLLLRFRIIIIEFHDLQSLTNDQVKVFNKLLKNHSCVHIHPNNCSSPIQIRNLLVPPIMEFTFLRNDRIAVKEFETNFPHPLDSENTDKTSVILPRCWYSH